MNKHARLGQRLPVLNQEKERKNSPKNLVILGQSSKNSASVSELLESLPKNSVNGQRTIDWARQK